MAALLSPRQSIIWIHFQFFLFELASSFLLHPDSFTKADTYKRFQASIWSCVSVFICWFNFWYSVFYLPSTAVIRHIWFLLQMCRCKHGTCTVVLYYINTCIWVRTCFWIWVMMKPKNEPQTSHLTSNLFLKNSEFFPAKTIIMEFSLCCHGLWTVFVLFAEEHAYLDGTLFIDYAIACAAYILHNLVVNYCFHCWCYHVCSQDWKAYWTQTI